MTYSSQQDLFDASLNHIREQGAPSMKWDGDADGCAYRGGEDEELSCAAAIFITEYLPEMDSGGGIPWRGLQHRYYIYLDHFARLASNTDLIQDLQSAHDSASRSDNFLDTYERRMQEVAERFSLQYEAA